MVRGLVHIRDLPISCSAAPSQDYLARIQGWDGFDFVIHPVFFIGTAHSADVYLHVDGQKRKIQRVKETKRPLSETLLCYDLSEKYQIGSCCGPALAR